MAKNVENENKVVNFEEATAAKKRGGRRKTNPLDDAPVAENKEVNIEEKMNAPVKVTMRDLARFCDEEHPDINALTKYFNDHNIINKEYIAHSTLVAAAHFIIDNTCFDEGGKYLQDTFAEMVFESVIGFYLFTNIDFDDMTYEQVFDYLRKYHLIEVSNILHEKQVGDLRKYCLSYINDIKVNEYSTEALISELIKVGNNVLETGSKIMNNPDIIKEITYKANSNEG